MAPTNLGGAIHVVAGILTDAQGRVLLAQRPPGKHLAGTWEFPGGKSEPGETPHAALRRELHEELGIRIGRIEPLIGIPWNYAEKSIFLDVYRVLDYAGTPHGREGQALEWYAPDDLTELRMPPPDRPVASALQLPSFYAITPEPGDDDGPFLAQVDSMLDGGIRLLQLRAKHVEPSRLVALARAVHERTSAAGARMLINGHVAIAQDISLSGVHLPAADLLKLKQRPLDRDRWIAASCHDQRELAHAVSIGVDFVVLGPVQTTQSHPGQSALGWSRFTELCAAAQLPVYALGGLARADLDLAKRAGAQGIAGISAFSSDRVDTG